MLIAKKDMDTYLGILPDNLIYQSLDAYGFDDSWIVLPFMNINNKALAINRRSETARKAVILYKEEVYILKEIPWYCASKDFVAYEMHLQENLRSCGNPIPKILKAGNGELFIHLFREDKEKFLFLQRFISGRSWAGTDTQDLNASRTLARLHKSFYEISRQMKCHFNPPCTTVFDLANKMLAVTQQVLKENSEHLCARDITGFNDFFARQSERIALCQETAFALGYKEIAVPIHGDYNPWNIVFDPNTGDASGIIDFDNSAIDNPVHDLAEFLLNFCFLKFRSNVTRYSEAPTSFDANRALMLISEYRKEYGEKTLHLLQYLTEAMVVTTIELFALGLVRGDYSLNELSTLETAIEIVNTPISRLVNNLLTSPNNGGK